MVDQPRGLALLGDGLEMAAAQVDLYRPAGDRRSGAGVHPDLAGPGDDGSAVRAVDGDVHDVEARVADDHPAGVGAAEVRGLEDLVLVSGDPRVAVRVDRDLRGQPVRLGPRGAVLVAMNRLVPAQDPDLP